MSKIIISQLIAYIFVKYLITVINHFKIMRIVIVPLNSDNYGYLIFDDITNEVSVVDVSDQPFKILEAIDLEKVKYQRDYCLRNILTTHKHTDHAGGNERMKELFPNINIYGSRIDNIEACTNFITDSDEFMIGSDIKVKCLLTPGHTMGHISYYITHNDENAVFTGDCLFVGGAGKFFEGTGSDMFISLFEKLAKLPLDTLVYCGHEYTLSNYRFALSIDNNNNHLIDANIIAKELRAEGKPTIPSTIKKELLTNPFLRASEEVLKNHFSNCKTTIDVLTAIRNAKNDFR